MPNTAPIDNTTWKCPTTYKVSCKTTSRVLLARITPLTPPIDKSPLTPIGSGWMMIIQY